MTEETKKYRILETNPYDLEDQMNELVAQGYKLHTFTTRGTQLDCVAVMSLSSAKYDDIEGLRDVPPGEANKLLGEGWIVADSYSKFIRMVKKK